MVVFTVTHGVVILFTVYPPRRQESELSWSAPKEVVYYLAY